MTYQKQRFEARIATEELIEKYFDPAVTLAKCRACRGFASTWSCPDFDFDPLDFWKGFSRFHLIVDRISNEGAASVAAAKDRLLAEKSLYDAEMLALEKERPGSCALAAQEWCPLYKMRPPRRKALSAPGADALRSGIPGHACRKSGKGSVRF